MTKSNLGGGSSRGTIPLRPIQSGEAIPYNASYTCLDPGLVSVGGGRSWGATPPGRSSQTEWKNLFPRQREHKGDIF